MEKKLSGLGIRHIALNVRDPQAAKNFYIRVLQMRVEWEPDPDNVYLTFQGHDNLALHRASGPVNEGALDHFGFLVPQLDDVDAWYAHIKKQGVSIVREIKTHRDGARSFYFRDPDGNTIQLIFHPPISQKILTG